MDLEKYLKKYEGTAIRPYSLRNMPLTMRHRIADEAGHECRARELEDKPRLSQEALILILIEEGLERREAERKRRK